MRHLKLFTTFVILLLVQNLSAQRGYSSASLSMNRSNDVVSPDQVLVEEYLNYHTHHIPLPERGKEVALSLDYHQVENENFVVQVGIATNRILDYSQLAPVNVSLVIDKSGSMSGDNKLEKVKRALSKFIEGLKDHDFVSIVAYDSGVQVVLPSTKVGEIRNLDLIIRSLTPGGSTNLHGGLMAGYREAEKNSDSNHNSKVILLTDGIANVGVTDPEEVVRQSVDYNKRGINISTIGVGSDLNYQLLQQLAEQGKGANHFVGNTEEDIQKVFDDELESLISPVGRSVFLELEYPAEMQLENVFGYSPEFKNNSVRIPLKNMNSGLTQVALFEFSATEIPEEAPLKASLTYVSYSTYKETRLNKELNLHPQNALFEYGEVLKNYSIAQMALAMKEMAGQVQNGNDSAAKQTIINCLAGLDRRFPKLKDQDIVRVKKILESNLEQLCRIKYPKDGIVYH